MRVYMDHNSTTPIDPRVVDAMVSSLQDNYGNPSSAHSVGVSAAMAVERARQQVAALVNAEAYQVVFCSSATEAINTVVRGVGAGTLVTSMVEHSATLESAKALAERGATIKEIRVDSHGTLDWATLEQAVAQHPRLVSIMWANNETGVMFPIAEIAKLCAAHGVLLHVDAVQAAGKVDIDWMTLPIAFLSVSSHKIFGPKGMAALLVRDTASLHPILLGGDQERGLRAGTENVAGIVGFGQAAELARSERVERISHVAVLRDELENTILAQIPGTRVNGAGSPRVANTSSIEFPGIDSSDLAGVLDGIGIAVSSGSACHSKAISPSHVLMAMTGSRRLASQSIRFSLSHLNTSNEVQYVVKSLDGALAALR
jgi:cysteine desulfurase